MEARSFNFSNAGCGKGRFKRFNVGDFVEFATNSVGVGDNDSKQYGVVVGVLESGNEYRYLVRWSTLELIEHYDFEIRRIE
jgi:hypothetical protein